MTKYKPRGMPARFMEGAPDIVRDKVCDLIRVNPPAPLDFDVIFKGVIGDGVRAEMTGLDFSAGGAQGCHFFLHPHDMAAYRAKNRRKRIAWRDLPEPTQRRIVGYLSEPT